jgi:hypothetical protein
MAIQKTLEMDFATELNRTHRIRIYDVREDLTPAEVSVAMDQIIAKNIFNGSGGEIIGKLNARIITKETEKLDLS